MSCSPILRWLLRLRLRLRLQQLLASSLGAHGGAPGREGLPTLLLLRLLLLLPWLEHACMHTRTHGYANYWTQARGSTPCTWKPWPAPQAPVAAELRP